MSSALDKIIDEVLRLPPPEQQQLRIHLDAIIPIPTEEQREDFFERQLAAEGVISLPSASVEVEDDWQPVEVTGLPPSALIIEERR